MSRSAGLAKAAAASVVGLMAALPYLAGLTRFGALDYRDYYWVLGQISDKHGFLRSPLTWLLVKSNEHTVTLPALVYMLNVRFASGDNRALSALTLGLMAVAFAVVLRLATVSTDMGVVEVTAIALICAPLTFPLAAAHNVVMGFSGTLWCLSNAFSLLAIAALIERPHSVRGAIVWAVMGAFTYTTSLLVWPALLLGAVVLRRRSRDLALIIVWTAGLLLFAIRFYARPEGHPKPEWRSGIVLWDYGTAYLGSVLSGDPATASFLGVIGVVLTAILIYESLRGRVVESFRLAPWIMIEVYAIGNAAATAVFRSRLSGSGPIESRYATLSGLFWLSTVLGTAFLFVPSRASRLRPSRRLRLAFVAGVSLVAVIPEYSRGLALLRSFLERASYNQVVAQAVQLGVHDDEMLGYITSFPSEVWSVVPFMKSAGHVPFEEVGRYALPSGVPVGGPSVRVLGSFDSLELVDPHFARACGWAFSTRGISDVLITDETGAVKGRGAVGVSRPDVGSQVGPGASTSGWCGYVRRDGRDHSYEAYASPRPHGGFAPLPGQHHAT